MSARSFAELWSPPITSEVSLFQSWLIQICRQLDLAAPNDERTSDPDCCFERRVDFAGNVDRRRGAIDCYRRGCFVMEAKRTGLDQAEAAERFGKAGRPNARAEALIRKAKIQAMQYAWALDEWPPFLVIVDVGRSIELWSDFARQGKAYQPFPDSTRHRITINRLDDPDIRARLRAVWMDSMSLDPASRIAEVTTDIAGRLGWLVRSIGSRGPEASDPVSHNAYADRWMENRVADMLAILSAAGTVRQTNAGWYAPRRPD